MKKTHKMSRDDISREITRNPLQTMTNYDKINGIVHIYMYMYIRRGSSCFFFYMID